VRERRDELEFDSHVSDERDIFEKDGHGSRDEPWERTKLKVSEMSKERSEDASRENVPFPNLDLENDLPVREEGISESAR